MSVYHKTWLATLGARRRDLAAVRNLPFAHTIRYPGDVTSWGIAGTVKAQPDNATELAAFTIGDPAFDGEFTSWTISLANSATLDLPDDPSGSGRVDLVYDILISGPSGTNPDATRLMAGLFILSGFVTETA